jgi:hypothetical protein
MRDVNGLDHGAAADRVRLERDDRSREVPVVEEVDGHRFREVVALRDIASEVPQLVECLKGFDTLGHDREPEVVAELDDTANDEGVVAFPGHPRPSVTLVTSAASNSRMIAPRYLPWSASTVGLSLQSAGPPSAFEPRHRLYQLRGRRLEICPDGSDGCESVLLLESLLLRDRCCGGRVVVGEPTCRGGVSAAMDVA